MSEAVAALIERAYVVDGDAATWLTEIVRASARALGRGVVGNLVERRPNGELVSAHVALEGVADKWCETLRRTAMRMRSAELEQRFTTAVSIERGVLALSARGDDRTAILLDGPLDATEPATPELLPTWNGIAEHLASGLRLRSRPSGAEDAWRALLEGRLALVDRFDRGGRRFVVVRATEPGERDPLTVRERQVLVAVARGETNKRIAVELDVSESTVSSALRGAARKLGVRSRIELARILGPPRVTSRS